MKLWVKAFAVLAVSILFVDCAPTLEAKDDDFIRPNTPFNLDKLKNLGKDDLAEEWSGQYQGDIIISDAEIQELESPKGSKTGLIDTRFRWPNNIVPYWINESHFTQDQVDYIHVGARRVEQVSCLKFVAYDPSIHTDFINVRGTGSGCSSSVGRRGGQQFLNLQPYAIETGCFRLYTIVHEFLHALGFYHMQSATDRDDYVRIVFDKIQSGTENNFNTYGSNVITHFGVDYDYGSVMHYGPTAFSIDGSQTIIPLRDLNGETMGQRLRISEKDIARVNRMYCDIEATTIPATTVTTTAATTQTTTQITVLPTTPQPPSVTTETSPGRPISVPELIRSINNFVNNLLQNIFGSFGRN